MFQVVREFYIFGIVTIFISSLGNRPQGSKWLYYGMSAIFALIMILMLFLGGWSIMVAASEYDKATKNAKVTFLGYFLNTPAFRDMLVSILATYGLYLAASLIHLDPWHIFTSMGQYLLLLPTYTNLFMIYSFCNLHDVSWGTKGDNTASKDNTPANVAKNENGEQIFHVMVPQDEDECSALWKGFKKDMERNYLNPQPEESKPNYAVISEDNCKEFRTKVVLSWMFSNAALIIIFTNQQVLSYFSRDVKNAVNPYLTFLFWSVAAFSLIRSTLFMVQWWKEKAMDAANAPARYRGQA